MKLIQKAQPRFGFGKRLSAPSGQVRPDVEEATQLKTRCSQRAGPAREPDGRAESLSSPGTDQGGEQPSRR